MIEFNGQDSLAFDEVMEVLKCCSDFEYVQMNDDSILSVPGLEILRLIQKEDLRDDEGKPFGFSTHMFRRSYGAMLTELHLDDWTIAKLLGHKGVSAVQHYRRMGRVMLEPGEEKTVQFTMKPSQLAFLNKDMEWLVEKGEIALQVGSSSEDIRLQDSFCITETKIVDGRKRGFYAQAEAVNNP